MPKPIKKKVVKHSHPEVEFKGIMSKFRKSAEHRKKLFIGLSAAVIVLIIATVGFFIYDNSMKKKAASLTNEAYQAYYEPAGVSNEERWNKAAELFKKAYDTKKSGVSLFYLANCQYETGKFDEALNSFDEIIRKFDDKGFAPLAYYKMALINLKKGNNADALKYLDLLYKLKSDSLKDLSLLESARILETLGKNEESLKKYEQLTREFPNSPFLGEALSKIGSKKG